MAVVTLFLTLPPTVDRLAWSLFAFNLLASLLSGWFWPPVQYRHRSWKLDETGITIREGVLTRHVRTVPLTRVQHLDLAQGFFERGLGLATLTIHTAGRSNAAVRLEGVTRDSGTRIRDYLLPRNEGDAL